MTSQRTSLKELRKKVMDSKSHYQENVLSADEGYESTDSYLENLAMQDPVLLLSESLPYSSSSSAQKRKSARKRPSTSPTLSTCSAASVSSASFSDHSTLKKIEHEHEHKNKTKMRMNHRRTSPSMASTAHMSKLHGHPQLHLSKPFSPPASSGRLSSKDPLIVKLQDEIKGIKSETKARFVSQREIERELKTLKKQQEGKSKQMSSKLLSSDALKQQQNLTDALLSRMVNQESVSDRLRSQLVSMERRVETHEQKHLQVSERMRSIEKQQQEILQIAEMMRLYLLKRQQNPSSSSLALPSSSATPAVAASASASSRKPVEKKRPSSASEQTKAVHVESRNQSKADAPCSKRPATANAAGAPAASVSAACQHSRSSNLPSASFSSSSSSSSLSPLPSTSGSRSRSRFASVRESNFAAFSSDSDQKRVAHQRSIHREIRNMNDTRNGTRNVVDNNYNDDDDGFVSDLSTPRQLRSKSALRQQQNQVPKKISSPFNTSAKGRASTRQQRGDFDRDEGPSKPKQTLLQQYRQLKESFTRMYGKS
eukprot:ANDGO_00381.mRNA.1 hypothetical protein